VTCARNSDQSETSLSLTTSSTRPDFSVPRMTNFSRKARIYRAPAAVGRFLAAAFSAGLTTFGRKCSRPRQVKHASRGLGSRNSAIEDPARAPSVHRDCGKPVFSLLDPYIEKLSYENLHDADGQRSRYFLDAVTVRGRP